MTGAIHPISDESLHETAALLSILGNPVRLRVLLLLEERGCCSAGEIGAAIGLEQSAMSHQLGVLRTHRLVKADREGRRIIYRVADHHVTHIVRDAVAHARERHEEVGAMCGKGGLHL